jgi:hypothetical protein
MSRKALNQNPVPQPRQRNKSGTCHSSEYTSTVNTALP